MPQPAAPQRPVRSRVSGGIPWWIWVILVVIGIGVGVAVVNRSLPVDPDRLFQEAMSAAEANDGATLERNLAQLREFPDREPECKLLEGVLMIGTSRPLKAIPLLKEASKDPELRTRSLFLLGGAYASATDRPSALSTFEELLQEEEDADNARFSAARILFDVLAWEEALKHLDVLVQRDYNPGMTRQMRGDIYLELGRYDEAIEEYEKAIAAEPTNPANSVKATRLMRCLVLTEKYDRIPDYVELVDIPSDREVARAENLLAKDDLKGALGLLDAIRVEDPHDADMNRTYGRIMLRHGTPEKAMEALANLKPMLPMATRHKGLYQVIADLARAAGDDQLASLVQQNVDLLDMMEAECNAKLAEVIKTRDDVDLRMALAECATNVGRYEFARSIYNGLSMHYPEREFEFREKIIAMYGVLPQLISTGPTQPSSGEAATSPDNATDQP